MYSIYDGEIVEEYHIDIDRFNYVPASGAFVYIDKGFGFGIIPSPGGELAMEVTPAGVNKVSERVSMPPISMLRMCNCWLRWMNDSGLQVVFDHVALEKLVSMVGSLES